MLVSEQKLSLNHLVVDAVMIAGLHDLNSKWVIIHDARRKKKKKKQKFLGQRR